MQMLSSDLSLDEKIDQYVDSWADRSSAMGYGGYGCEAESEGHHDAKIGVSRIVLSAFGRPQFIHPFGTRLLSCTPWPEGVLRRLFR
jgi:hypothetical protein